MSKLAHSNERSMLQIDIRSAIEDGNQDLILTAFDALKADNKQLKKRANWAQEALARIYMAAGGICDGEENPFEAAQDIQRMVFNGMSCEQRFRWTHKASESALAQGGEP